MLHSLIIWGCNWLLFSITQQLLILIGATLDERKLLGRRRKIHCKLLLKKGLLTYLWNGFRSDGTTEYTQTGFTYLFSLKSLKATNRRREKTGIAYLFKKRALLFDR